MGERNCRRRETQESTFARWSANCLAGPTAIDNPSCALWRSFVSCMRNARCLLACLQVQDSGTCEYSFLSFFFCHHQAKPSCRLLSHFVPRVVHRDGGIWLRRECDSDSAKRQVASTSTRLVAPSTLASQSAALVRHRHLGTDRAIYIPGGGTPLARPL